MRLEAMLIGLLVFSMIMVGGSLILYDVKESYDLELEDDEALKGLNSSNKLNNSDSVYNTMDEIEAIASSTQGRAIGDDRTGIQEETGSEGLFAAAYNSIVFVGNSFGLMKSITSNLANAIGIPGWIGTAFYTMFVLAVIFTVIYLLFRFQTR